MSKQFLVTGALYSFDDMARANKDDVGLCHWLCHAEIGDTFADGEGCQRVSDADPWHLFYIVATGSKDREWRYLVSAQSGSDQKAEELARAAVDDKCPQSMRVESSEYVCIVAEDMFIEL